MAHRLFSTVLKLLLVSLLAGVALSAFDITAAQLLRDFGLAPEQVFSYLRGAVSWALPHILVGALITVPVWLVMYWLHPPR